MSIKKIKLIKRLIYKDRKGQILKYVSIKDNFFKSFGEIYFNKINKKKKKAGIIIKKVVAFFSVFKEELNSILQTRIIKKKKLH